MIQTIGHISLCAAVLLAAAALPASFFAARARSETALRWAIWAIQGICAGLTVASIALTVALLRGDFRFDYVVGYTERALPTGYKLAAFWAGQEGSLLLWGWLLAVMCVVAVHRFRRLEIVERSIATGTLAVVGGFFSALLLFTADPFRLVEGPVPMDGRGLNPMLQDPGMIAHPPLLFMGYAGFTVPFAVLIGVLVAGRTDNRWLADVRRWLIFSWVFLTAGIVLGAWWAYVELGWGGYWAWDPVENASLLPWLTATALMHSIMAQQHRGMLKLWNASLIGLTFLLCILGTYLTRSGVVSSVHAFAPSLIGTFFLAFLTLSTATTAGLIIWRRRALRSEVAMDGLLSREGAFLLANLLLLLITLTILVGTVFPILSGLFTDEPITVQPTFYNRVVAPMGVLLVAIMAAGPVLSFGKDAARTLGRRLLVPAIVAVAVTAVVWWSGITSFWMLLCVAIATIGTGAVIIDLARSLAARRRSTGEGWVTAGVQLIDHDHRRYGGQLAHLGVMMLVIGVAGSSLFSRDTVVRLHPGEDARLGGYTITLVSLDEVRDVNFTAVQATVKLTEPGGLVRHLRPQRRFYDTWREPNTEIAVRSNLRDDVYVSLAGWERGGAIAAIQVRMNPLVMWIWIGGIVMSVGGVLCVLPRLLPQARRAEAVEPAEAVATAKGSREPRAEPVLTPATKVEVSS